ncbi:hypothetical protein L810_4282 [Burkholderia sp. AU4i]|nr:hypothetical protein L810_4282 [Burkholderia sp. AU4i]
MTPPVRSGGMPGAIGGVSLRGWETEQVDSPVVLRDIARGL